jgi:hypothetical protein
MKSREVKYWLYSFRPNASWPVDVVGHLQQCPKCQQLQTKLKQIDASVDKLTGAAGTPTAKAQLLDRIATTPQADAPKAPPNGVPKAPWPWWRLGAYLTAAAALIGLGWLVGRQGDRVDIEPKIVTEFRDRVEERIVQVQSPAERILFSTLLKRNARLVQSSQPSDRLDTLLDMADDCRKHVETLIEQGPRESLPLSIDLYTQLLREGVLVQVALAPVEARPPLQKTARARLAKMAEEPAKALPAVLSEQQEAMQNATQEAIELVDEPDKIKPRPKQSSQVESLSPAATLVRFAVTVSSENDPVVKADLCTHYVKRLLPTMNLYLSEDSVPQRGEMGQQFGELIQFGVYRPLELASAKEPTPPVAAETQRIFEFAAETVASMEKSLEQAPKEARQGFEKAIEPSKKAREKTKGKGPPAGKGKNKTDKGPRDNRSSLKSVDNVAGFHGEDTLPTSTLNRDALKAILGKSAGAHLQLRLAENRRTVVETHTNAEPLRKFLQQIAPPSVC